MTEAMRTLFRQPDVPTLAGERAFPEERTRTANGTPLRWTPGPDELRLPSREDEPVSQNSGQFVAIVDGFDGLERHWKGRSDVFVSSDQFIYWDPAYDSRKNPVNPPPSPDLYVVFGVADRPRSTYVVWEEGKPPDFVLEIVSPSSRRRDKEEKRVLYAKMGVPEFFLYDPESEGVPLWGFKLRNGTYVQLPEERLEEDLICVHSDVLGLCLCAKPSKPRPRHNALRWYDPVAEKFLSSRHGLDDDRQRAEEKVDAEKNRADAERNRADVAERGRTAEKNRADAEKNRADVAERGRTTAENRADAAERELARLRLLLEGP